MVDPPPLEQECADEIALSLKDAAKSFSYRYFTSRNLRILPRLGV
jgi:hypothetical protein